MFDGNEQNPRNIGRRKTGTPPAITSEAERSLQAVDALPEPLRKLMRAIVEPLTRLASIQDVFNRAQNSTYQGRPAPHNTTHVPDSQIDPLPVGTPSGLANANAEGSANAFVRQDHQHKRDVRVAVAGVDVGTRNRLNFVAGITASDDSVNDEIDIMSVADDAYILARQAWR